MAIADADTGKVIATLPIGAGVDATAFDPDTQLAFSSNGVGTLTVVKEESPDKFAVVENVPTRRGAGTMAQDRKTHNTFLATAEFEPPVQREKYARVKPGSFVILVAGQ